MLVGKSYRHNDIMLKHLITVLKYLIFGHLKKISICEIWCDFPFRVVTGDKNGKKNQNF